MVAQCGTRRSKAPSGGRIARRCLTCDVRFFAFASTVAAGGGRFCGRKCYGSFKRRSSLRACAVCSAPFKARNASDPQRACGPICGAVANRRREERSCVCGETFEVRPSSLRKFCSAYCRHAHTDVSKLPANVRATLACRGMLRRVLLSTKKRKSAKTEAILGYTFAEFRAHIESRFESWMSWENYGEWHVDHVVPIRWFLRNGIRDPRVINALENLQPLRGCENLAKRDRLLVDPKTVLPGLATVPKRVDDREWLAQQFDALTVEVP